MSDAEEDYGWWERFTRLPNNNHEERRKSMSEVITGKINWMGDEKKFGNYGFKVSGHEEWFRAKKRYEGILEKGNTVTLKVKENAKGDYELVATPVKAKGAAASSGGKSSGGKSYGGGDGDTRGPAIQWQHSQEMAISAAGLILAQGGFKLGAKPDAKKTQILALIDELTAKFYTEIESKPGLKAAKELADDLDEDAEEEDEEQDGDDPDFEADDDDGEDD